MKTWLLSLFLFLFTSPVLAEYRVFLLKISKNQAAPNVPASFNLVESTLDPDQYRGYYTVAADETVTYIDTWRCFGRTNDLPLCPNPRQPAAAAPEGGAIPSGATPGLSSPAQP